MIINKLISVLKRVNKMATNIDVKLDCSNRANYLLNSALTSNESIIAQKPDADTELIVSFTTYSKRIHDVHLVVESIAQQTLKPNRLILWLDEDEFTLDTIPLILKKQMERGLDIRFCPNYRSYKKLIPTLQKYPEANVITIDDDILYPHDMIEILCKEHAQHPGLIIGHRAHKMTFNLGKLENYKQWDFQTTDCNPSDFTFITTGAGTLFPSRCFSKEALDSDKFLSLCPNADDVWFKAMSLLNDKPHKKVTDNRPFWSRFFSLETSQDIALANSNFVDNRNDLQIKAVFKHYKLNEKLYKGN